MPKYGIVNRKDKVTANLARIRPNLHIALENGAIEVMELSNAAIRQQITRSVTPTGQRRAAGEEPLFKARPAWYLHRGPGRIESSRMINSVRWTMNSHPGHVEGQSGYITPPSYLRLQEEGDNKIPPMHSIAMGQAVLSAHLQPKMSAQVARALRAAELNRSATTVLKRYPGV